MAQETILLTLFGMALVTYIPRLLPIWTLSSRTLPPLVETWLRYVPVAVLAAMLFPSLLISDSQLNITPSNLFLWAAVPTALLAWKTKSLFLSVFAGMLIVAGVRMFAGL